MFVVRCPHCKQTMRYQPIKEGLIKEKKKRCVYCGHTFLIHRSLIASRIVREEQANTHTPLWHHEDQVRFFQKLDRTSSSQH